VWSEVTIPEDVNTQGSSVPRLRGDARSIGKPSLLYCKRKSPFSLFKNYYTNEVMMKFVNNINSFARRSNISRWSNVTINEPLHLRRSYVNERNIIKDCVIVVENVLCVVN
jgi:cytochrome c biogenesis protein ResB